MDLATRKRNVRRLLEMDYKYSILECCLNRAGLVLEFDPLPLSRNILIDLIGFPEGVSRLLEDENALSAYVGEISDCAQIEADKSGMPVEEHIPESVKAIINKRVEWLFTGYSEAD